jgi:hypothetical protein
MGKEYSDCILTIFSLDLKTTAHTPQFAALAAQACPDWDKQSVDREVGSII